MVVQSLALSISIQAPPRLAGPSVHPVGAGLG